jgi:hypothetical protein
MLQSIQFIPGVDSQQLELSLRSLALVNILVGPNGSGKSRVLRGIRRLDTNANTKGASNEIVISPEGISLTVAGEFDSNPQPMHANNLSALKFLQKAFEVLGLGELKERNDVYHAPAELGSKQTVSTAHRREVSMNDVVIVRDEKFLEFESVFSAGTIRLAEIYAQIEAFKQSASPHKFNPDACLVILIEEIEKTFHPAALKKILAALVECAHLRRNGISGSNMQGHLKISVPTQIFITTHSPFLISAAAEFSSDLVKVYLLKDGKTADIKGKAGGESGYGGTEALFAANAMLGASQRDYIPDQIILAEDSIQQFLSAAAKTLGGSVGAYQASTSGDSKTGKAAKTLLSLTEGHLELGNDQPWKNVLTFRITVFLDGPPDSNDTQKWKELKSKYGDKFSCEQISEKEFETCHPREIVNEFLKSKNYPEWHQLTFKGYASALPEIAKTSNEFQKATAIGRLKCELAKFIGEKINLELLKENYPKLRSVLNLPPS